MTITGGATHSSFGQSNTALGGGVWVPPAANDATGATLTITGTVITGNTVAPTTAVDAGFSCGPTGECQFAQAGGGGIDSWGYVTLEHTTVSNNEAAGALTSDADGAGIYSQQGTLSVERSVVTDNRAIATIPNGRFAEGAGIMFDTTVSPPSACVAPAPACALVVRNSVVSENTSTLTSNLPSFGDGQLISMNANAGGIHVGDGIATTVEGAAIIGNSATATDPQGEPIGFDAGMLVGNSPLVMHNAQIDDNRATTTSATSADVGPSGTALELDGGGRISNTSILGNVAISVSPGGAAEGGGIWNGLEAITGALPPVQLTLENTRVTENSLTGTSGITLQGGGLFTTSPVTLTNTTIARNRPDQCLGC